MNKNCFIIPQIFLHGNDFSSLHGFITPDVLPTEYGGTAGDFDNRAWHLQLLSEENYFKELETYGYKVDQNLSEAEEDV